MLAPERFCSQPPSSMLFRCLLNFVSVGLVTGFFAQAETLDVTMPPFSASGDGVRNDREAIQKAVDQAAAKGGGVVLLPTGKTFLSGTIELKTGVALSIATNAILRSSLDPSHYPHPATLGHYHDRGLKLDSKEFSNYPLVYAGSAVVDIKVLGPGTIQIGEKAGADSNQQMFLSAVGFFQVTRFELKGFGIRRGKGVQVQLHDCSEGTVDSVDMRQPYTEPLKYGTEGLSIEGCRDLIVKNCQIEANDNQITIWSTYRDPRAGTWWKTAVPRASRNITLLHNATHEVDRNRFQAVGAYGLLFLCWGGDVGDDSTTEIADIKVQSNSFATSLAVGALGDDPFRFEHYPSRIRNLSFTNNVLMTPLGQNRAVFWNAVPVSNLVEDFPAFQK